MARGSPPKQVICVDTGVIYESVIQCHKQTGVWFRNIRFGIPYKGRLYQYYNPCEHPGCIGKEDEEIEDTLYYKHFLRAFRDKHPEYNNVTKTMTAKEYADYLKERKGLK